MIIAAAPSLTPEALPAVTVPGSRTKFFSLASASSVVSGRRCSSLLDRDRPGFAARHDHRLDLLVEETRRLGLGGALLRAERKSVLVLAADLIVLGDVLGGVRHRIDAVLLLHQRIDEAPADGGVLDRRRCAGTPPAPCPSPAAPASSTRRRRRWRSRSRRRGSRCAASPTAFNPDAHSRLTVQPGTESGRPGQQQRHARDVAVVLAGLVGAAEIHLVERRPIELRMPLHQRLERDRARDRRSAPWRARRHSGRSACARRRR